MSDEMKKYIGVLMEDTNEKFKLLGEGISLNYDLLKKVTDDVAVLKTDVSELKTKTNVIQQDVNTMKKDIGVMKEDISKIKQGIKEIKKDNKEKDTQVSLIDKRVSELELA